MQKIYSWLFLFGVLWSACSKDFPPDMLGDPVFSAQAQLDTQTISIRAGVDSVYLFTSHKYQPDVVDAVVFIGAFAATNCPDAFCPGSLTFELRNSSQGPNVFPDSAFAPGLRSYLIADQAQGDTIRHTVFSTEDTVDYPSFQWVIDSSAPVSGKSVTVDFPDNGPHKVSLLGYRNGALKSIVSRTIVPENTVAFPGVSITVSDSMSDSTFLLTANTFGAPIAGYEWNTGETTQQIAVHQLDENYRVKVTSFSNDTASAQILTIDPDFPQTRTADFSYSVEIIPPPPVNLQLNTVLIRWIDENGDVWESYGPSQSATSSFTILSSEDYDLNENGQKTRKMNVSFSCFLFKSNNPSLIRPISGTAVIAVAYP